MITSTSTRPIRIKRIAGTLALVILTLISFYGKAQTPTTGDYQSNTSSGTWSTASHWAVYNGSSWVTASTAPSSSTTGNITIQSGHTMAIGSSVTLNGTLDIVGGLTINQNQTLTNNNLVTLESTGTLTAGGTGSKLSISSGARFKRSGGTFVSLGTNFWNIIYGTYEHNCDLSTANDLPIPSGGWASGSTCE